MPTPVNSNDEMNIATMTRTMFRGLGLDELSGTELTRTRVFRQFNSQSGEYDYAVIQGRRSPRIVTTRQIVDASEQRQQARAESERQAAMEEIRSMSVHLRPAPGASFDPDSVRTIPGELGQIERPTIRPTQGDRFRPEVWSSNIYNRYFREIGLSEQGLPPPERNPQTYASPRFSLEPDFTEQEVRRFISEMNNEIYSLLASDHQIAALVAKPPLIASIKHHLRGEVFVRMEPMRLPVGEYVDVSIAPATPTQRVVSSGPDMLLGYRLVADDAADPYWIVVKPRR